MKRVAFARYLTVKTLSRGATLLLLASLPLHVRTVQAQDAADETLIQAIPHDYKVASNNRVGDASLTEMIPNGESLDSWTEMVTTQIYYGAEEASFARYRHDMESRWRAACDTSDSSDLDEGKQNGYAFKLWIQSCHFNNSNKPPEFTWFKMIQGNDSAYVVQKSYHYRPSKAEITATTRYLHDVKVCDSRVDDRDCSTMNTRP